LKRYLSRWRGRQNVFKLHALRFWYGSTLQWRFIFWRKLCHRLRRMEVAASASSRQSYVRRWGGVGRPYQIHVESALH